MPVVVDDVLDIFDQKQQPFHMQIFVEISVRCDQLTCWLLQFVIYDDKINQNVDFEKCCTDSATKSVTRIYGSRN